jgi:hypothetical protein
MRDWIDTAFDMRALGRIVTSLVGYDDFGHDRRSRGRNQLAGDWITN